MKIKKMNTITLVKNLIMFLSIVCGFTSVNAQTFLEKRNPEKITNWEFAKVDFTIGGKELRNNDKMGLKTVSIPHTWNAKDILTHGSASYHGVGTYIHKLKPLQREDNKRHFIRFEGVSSVSEVYVNKKFVGQHEGGYSAFCYEITDFLNKGGVNEIIVKVSNVTSRNVAPSSERLYPIFGGIYRPVTYFTTNQACISPLDYASSGVYIEQTSISKNKAEVDVTVLTSVQNTNKNYDVKISFLDKEGVVVASETETINVDKYGKGKLSKKRISINKPHLWRGRKNPYLYTCTVDLLENGIKVDEVIQHIGMRSFKVTPKKGFFLNEESYPLFGVNRHQEVEGYGPALSTEHHQQDFELINELGANSVRLAHYQQADEFYDMFDKAGIMVWAEIPNTPPYPKNNPKYIANCKQQLAELIKQNFNKTAIYCWGLGNEISIPKKDLETLSAYAKSIDSTRFTVFVDNTDTGSLHSVVDLQTSNMYYGWYEDNLKDGYSKRIDNIYKKFPEFRVGISEFGAGGSISQQKEDFERPNPINGRFFSEQYQTYYHENAWNDIKNRDDIWCKYIWNMFDFSWGFALRGDRDFINHKGLITHDRKIKKDAFYFYKANWSPEPVLHITNKRLIYRQKQNTFIKVYSNLDSVELFLNGRKLSNKKVTSDIHIVRWDNIKLVKGNNSIDVIGYKGKQKFVDHCDWHYRVKSSK